MIIVCPHCHNVIESDFSSSVKCPKCKLRETDNDFFVFIDI